MALNPYERVLKAREKGRATTVDYLDATISDFVELHGDRRFGDDQAIIGGIGRLGQTPVTVIGIEKGKKTRERVQRNFGSAHPEGYRKAIRLMHQAEKFGRPVICFVDTTGAFCGIDAEQRGQGQAIAESILTMCELTVPTITVIIGEGGSGGALALSVADSVWMMENSIYSVISPEGCATILWKDSRRVAEASEVLKLTAPDLLELGIIDDIVAESGHNWQKTLKNLKNKLTRQLITLQELSAQDRASAKHVKFRKIGVN